MTTPVDTKPLLKLTPAQRLGVIAELWESLVKEGAAIPLAEESLDEAERRIEAMRADPKLGIPLDELRKRRGWTK